ncbi:hypothetical protein MKY96_24285 [Paenibacillus sp. FSL R7-0302]|uniref:hypothetical protein n=1 Tax=Paenibacillus sp. FSL R7-0302 TaxID=2921681 RepID=UPI0030FA9E2F
MENKKWKFQLPGNPDGIEIAISTSEIRTVHDLLSQFRQEELMAAQKQQAERRKPQPKAPVVSLASRLQEKRRHPTA